MGGLVSRAGWSKSKRGKDTEKISHVKKQYECLTIDSIPTSTATVFRTESAKSEFDRLSSECQVDTNAKAYSPKKDRPPEIVVSTSLSRFNMMGESSDSPRSPGKTSITNATYLEPLTFISTILTSVN